MSELSELAERRSRAEDKVIASLNCLPRSVALRVVLSYVPLSRLEEALPTICGSEPMVEDPVEAFAHKLRYACITRDLQPMVVLLKDGRKGAKRRTKEEMDLLVKEAFTEALR